MTDNATPPETPADAADNAPAIDLGAPQSDAISPPLADDDETHPRTPRGVTGDTVIIIPSDATPPMRQPERTWALWLTAVDMIDAEVSGDLDTVALFAGHWLTERREPTDADGDLIVLLTRSGRGVDVELLWAHRGRWRVVGAWYGVGAEWPHLVAHTAAAIMGLQKHEGFNLNHSRDNQTPR